MKKFFVIIFFGLLWFNTGNAGIYGRGEVKLAPHIVDYFIDYLKGSHNKTPLIFFISVDGKDAYFWYCPYGQGNCRSANTTEMAEACEDNSGKECKVFARNRTVRWKNDINPGKGKVSKFNSKMSRTEIIAKLTDLGFLGNATTKKIEKKKKTSQTDEDKDIVQQLKDLGKLYNSGVLTKEEFEVAKKKLLN